MFLILQFADDAPFLVLLIKKYFLKVNTLLESFNHILGLKDQNVLRVSFNHDYIIVSGLYSEFVLHPYSSLATLSSGKRSQIFTFYYYYCILNVLDRKKINKNTA